MPVKCNNNLESKIGDSRAIMSPMQLKMQPTIHLERQAGIKMYCGLHFQFRRAHYYS
jgi:hypothetical protein